MCLPSPLFKDSYSVILNDNEGNLLSAKIAEDGQWRFPESSRLNSKFIYSILAFEDEYFFNHRGVNPVSIWRAILQNRKAGKIISGGSTVTMQLTRLMRKNQKRTYYEKLIELILALRIELTYSKAEILKLYSSHAPFGTNVVGVEAASWRYFGRSLSQLSWAECATLAVLPNSPSIIYPGKNQERLRIKRNKLLYKLVSSKYIDEETYALAIQEPLPQKPFPLPNKVRHLLNRALAENPAGNNFKTTINSEVQNRVLEIVGKHASALKQNEIHNLCVLVLDVEKNEVISYIGNTPIRDNDPHGEDVDVIMSNRSTGSLLKPYLYGFMLNDGQLLPNMLIPDVPTQIAGYVPQNFDFTYDGAVPAKQALSRSLNIPAVKMLQQYTVNKFLDRLKQIGLSSMNRSADNYGLSLILGGGEARLWDMCSAYASMARVLHRYNKTETYSVKDWKKPHYVLNDFEKSQEDRFKETSLISASSIWLTFEAMAEVGRPDIDASWQRLGNAQKIAWKTGTSFGFRDGWAIGVSGNYVVGVWVGNADGEGRPGLTGISAAAPVLFEIFGSLPKSNWFRMPVKDLKSVSVCKQSGCLASSYCVETRSERIPKNSNVSITCSYHKPIHVDVTEQFRVTDACELPLNMKTISWFVLPPVQEYYFKSKNPLYRALPPYKPGCEPEIGRSMEMIYPKAGTVIYIPYELSGEQGKTVFEIAHREASSTVFWHVDGTLIGTTRDIHQLGFNPTKGKHMLSLSDNTGETLNIPFEVLSEKK
ncbi:MAG: penicillin-binding protein [Bacteroidetes bacterium]|nr:penicillin-binding protein [Bacteroidota bacterium]MDF2452365.1 penicillin-binding protein [Bacteroidota bacterium]